MTLQTHPAWCACLLYSFKFVRCLYCHALIHQGLQKRAWVQVCSSKFFIPHRQS